MSLYLPSGKLVSTDMLEMYMYSYSQTSQNVGMTVISPDDENTYAVVGISAYASDIAHIKLNDGTKYLFGVIVNDNNVANVVFPVVIVRPPGTRLSLFTYAPNASNTNPVDINVILTLAKL